MSKVEVAELRGFSAWRAFNAYHKLMLGLKMLPQYAHESYEEFYTRLDAMPEHDKLAVIKEAAALVELMQDEVEALVVFCKDPNGIPYGPENLAGLDIAHMFDIVVAVCFEISKIKVDFISEDEKKN